MTASGPPGGEAEAPGGAVADPHHLRRRAKVYEAVKDGASATWSSAWPRSRSPRPSPRSTEAGWSSSRGSTGASWTARQRRPPPGARHSRLTEVELEVLQFIAKGLSNAEVGRVMSIERRTVRTHLTHIYEKLRWRATWRRWSPPSSSASWTSDPRGAPLKGRSHPSPARARVNPDRPLRALPGWRHAAPRPSVYVMGGGRRGRSPQDPGSRRRPRIRRIIARTLAPRFEVLTAAGGDEAVSIRARAGGRGALRIT